MRASIRFAAAVLLGVTVAASSWYLFDLLTDAHLLTVTGGGRWHLVGFIAVALIGVALLWTSRISVAAAVASLALGLIIGVSFPELLPTTVVEAGPNETVVMGGLDLRLLVVRGANEPLLYVLLGTWAAILMMRLLPARPRVDETEPTAQPSSPTPRAGGQLAPMIPSDSDERTTSRPPA